MFLFLLVIGIVLLLATLVSHFAATVEERRAREEFAGDHLGIQNAARALDARQVATDAPVLASTPVETETPVNESHQTIAQPVIAAPEVSSQRDRWRDLTVVQTVDESIDCRSFYFASIDGQPLPPFHAGQYLIVSLPDPESPQRNLSRCYSLSDGVSDLAYRITVKRVPGGKMSNLLHDTVHAGDSVRVQLPSGKFHIGNQPSHDQEGNPRPLNLIAAGIGITPMLSMLRQSERLTPERPVRLFYQLRSSENAPFLKELKIQAKARRVRSNYNFGFRLYVAFSKPLPGDLQRGVMNGRMSAEDIVHAAGSPAGDFMICGPDEFMEGIASGLIAAGAAPECVHYESFSGPPKPKAQPIATGENASTAVASPGVAVRFEKSGCDVQWLPTDASLLETAERCGIPIDSACRSGQCGSCIVRQLAGRVRYAESPEYEPLAPGEILACVAQPDGPVTLDA